MRQRSHALNQNKVKNLGPKYKAEPKGRRWQGLFLL
jgi:hypothetical protein